MVFLFFVSQFFSSFRAVHSSRVFSSTLPNRRWSVSLLVFQTCISLLADVGREVRSWPFFFFRAVSPTCPFRRPSLLFSLSCVSSFTPSPTVELVVFFLNVHYTYPLPRHRFDTLSPHRPCQGLAGRLIFYWRAFSLSFPKMSRNPAMSPPVPATVFCIFLLSSSLFLPERPPFLFPFATGPNLLWFESQVYDPGFFPVPLGSGFFVLLFLVSPRNPPC